jgi:hypothetical protein
MKMIAACLLTEDAEGNNVTEKRLFGSMTRELHELAQWLCAAQVTAVAVPVHYRQPHSEVVGAMQHQTGLGGQRRPRGQCDGYAARAGAGRNGCRANGRHGQEAIAEKDSQLQLALEGCVLPHHRWLLREMIEDLDHVGAKITRIEETIEQQMRPFQEAVNRWLTVPGIKHRLAWTLVAEVGPTVDAFPSAADIVSWAGVCPRQQPDRRQTKERHHARR